MRILSALAFLAAFAIAPLAQAACPNPFTAKDAAGTTQNFASQNDASNNCVAESAAYAAVQFSGTLQSVATANGNGTAVSVAGMAGGTMTVNCASCSGGTTVNFEAQEDGSNFAPIQGIKLDGSAVASTVTTAGVTDWQFNLAGIQQVRARISAYSAGTITVTIHAISVPAATQPTTIGVTSLPATPAGTNVIGKFGIDQTTPGTTNGVQVNAGSAIIGKTGIDQTTDITTNGVEIAPSAASASGIAPVVSSAVEATHVLKGSAGNLYSVMVQTGSTPGCLMIFNATTAPADGAVTPAVAPIEVAANSTAGVTFANGSPPAYMSTGISVAFSSTCGLTKTASATALFSGMVK